MSTRQPAERQEAVRRAYAVLGDPRLRMQYDRGEVVGVGIGLYYQAGRPAIAGSAPPSAGRSRGGLAARWDRRWAQRPPAAALPAGPAPRVGRAVGLGLAVGVSLIGAAGVVNVREAGTDASSSSAAASGAVTHPAVNVPAPPRSAPAPYVSSGSCFLLGANRQLQPSHPVRCEQPHDVEVIKVVDLVRLACKPVGSDADRLASSACSEEFTSFTGLAGPTTDMWPTWLTTTGRQVATATCLVTSRYPRASTARQIAR